MPFCLTLRRKLLKGIEPILSLRPFADSECIVLEYRGTFVSVEQIEDALESTLGIQNPVEL